MEKDYDREKELELHPTIRRALGVEVASMGSMDLGPRSTLMVKIRERSEGDRKVELRLFYEKGKIPGKGILLEPRCLEWVIDRMTDAKRYLDVLEKSNPSPVKDGKDKKDRKLRELRGKNMDDPAFPAEVDLKEFM
jgi:hypothetical protein